jgi:MerR family transcriptional regulator, light-induced transcriptional regulator
MAQGNPMAAEVLEASAAGFASAANAHLQRTQPAVGQGDSTAWRLHFQQRVLELAAAVRVGDPALFVRRIEWLRRAADARTGDDASVALALRSLDAAVRQEAPAALQGSITTVLDAALEGLGRPLEPETMALNGSDPADRLASQYIAACLNGEFTAAAEAVLAAADNGMAPRDLYCRVLMPAQSEVGRLWHRGDLNVAEERLISETTRRIMAQIAARYEPREKSGRKMLAASVEGNAHDLGLRAATDLFVLAGWQCFYLGANVPPKDIALTVEAHGIDLVLLAATLETQLGASAGTIATIKRMVPSCKTIIGGMPFDDPAAVLRQIGADAYCPRIDDVVAMAEDLLRKGNP